MKMSCPRPGCKGHNTALINCKDDSPVAQHLPIFTLNTHWKSHSMTNPPTIIELPVFPTDRSHIGHGGVENNNIQSGAVITTEGDWGPGREGISWAEMSLIKPPSPSIRFLLGCVGPQAWGHHTKLCWRLPKSMRYFWQKKKTIN